MSTQQRDHYVHLLCAGLAILFLSTSLQIYLGFQDKSEGTAYLEWDCSNSSRTTSSRWENDYPKLAKTEMEQKINFCKLYEEYSFIVNATDARIAHIESNITNSLHPYFNEALTLLDNEKRRNLHFKKLLKKHKVKSIAEYYWPLTIFYLAIIVTCFFGDRAIVRTWYHARHEYQEPFRCGILYWLITILISTLLIAIYFYTSACQTNKTFIAPPSFYINPYSWSLERGAGLGLAMIIAIPMTRLWKLTRRDLVPKSSELNLSAPDGKCGVGNYILFLQIWCIVPLAGVLTSCIIQFRLFYYSQDGFDPFYLAPSALGLITILIYNVRLAHKAIVVRLRYEQCIAKQYPTFDSLLDAKIAPDPTRDFIGETWWKLPTSIFGSLGAAWAVLEWTGVTQVVLEAMQ